MASLSAAKLLEENPPPVRIWQEHLQNIILQMSALNSYTP